ncbi:MAG TPA: glycoside hydrolase family 2 TIM barrel-domain containing protein, partial [Phycisphaerae bacterium]|nr:glycoside hydrolase family 2 TIM barrel-domain containing protein [Phycisphaerae bacterium]
MLRHPRVLLAAILALAGTARAAEAPASPRQHLSLDANWQFTRGDPAGAEKADFDDKAWRTLDVPHDWSIEGPYDQANTSGGQGGFVPTGIGWYRRHFTTPASFAGKSVTVQFDGIYMNATAYLNGKQIARQPYGYTSFTADLTPNLAPEGKENILAVRVDNNTQPSARWYTGSGIYRHVWVDVTEQVHIAPLGVYVTTPGANPDAAKISVKNEIITGGVPVENITLTHEILNPDGSPVAGGVEVTGVKRAQDNLNIFTDEQWLSIKSPRLWSVEKPALYSVRTTLKVGTKIVDQLDTPFGIRTLDYDVNKGLLINGQHTKLLGMCLHHDGGAMGAAVPIEVWERRLTALKTMGCNAIRCSHNPPAPEFLDLCDRLGFLVMDGAFDEWTAAKGQLRGSYATIFNDNYKA